jgi:curved DNA-binding protein CbpA
MNKNQIVGAYRRLAMSIHPDQGGDQEAFIELNLAYERLVADK